MSDVSRRLASMLGRGVVEAVDAARKLQALQIKLLQGELKDRVEHFEPFGLTAHALPGAEHLTVFLDGDRSHGVTLAVCDRRYRVQGLPAGGVALYDADGSKVVLSADGLITLTAATKVVIDAPLLHVQGDILADGDVSDQGGDASMSGMRSVYNGHTHPVSGGSTNVPNQQQ